MSPEAENRRHHQKDGSKTVLGHPRPQHPTPRGAHTTARNGLLCNGDDLEFLKVTVSAWDIRQRPGVCMFADLKSDVGCAAGVGAKPQDNPDMKLTWT